jgi:hypothetical protein
MLRLLKYLRELKRERRSYRTPLIEMHEVNGVWVMKGIIR